MKEIRFSIIIPQLNKAQMTEQCIDSVINNTIMPYEIILVDNGSTEEISDKYKKKVTYVKSDTNLLFHGGCNLGASKAKNDYLCFLNNDILLQSGWEDCLEYLSEHEDVGLIGPKLLYPNGTIQHAGVQVLDTRYETATFDHRYRGFAQWDPRVNEIREYQCMTGALFFVRKNDWEAVGGLDDGYHNGYEDNDLCFKIRFNLNKKVVYFPQSVATHLESVTSSTVPYSEEPNKKRFFERWGDKLKEDRSYWDRVDSGQEFKVAIIYKTCEKELNKSEFKDERPEWYDKKKCFSSFYKSLSKCSQDIDVHVVFDGNIDGDFATFIKSHEGINFISVDIKSMYKANQYCYQLAEGLDFDYCYFLEDDYLHREDAISVLVDGLQHFDDKHVLSLYDHPDRYTRDDDLTKDKESVFALPSGHWRTGESTTHTFALSKKTLMDNKDIFNTEAFYTNDRDLFRALYTQRGIRLVTPLPGRSTHGNKYFLSPYTNWEAVNEDNK